MRMRYWLLCYFLFSEPAPQQIQLAIQMPAALHISNVSINRCYTSVLRFWLFEKFAGVTTAVISNVLQWMYWFITKRHFNTEKLLKKRLASSHVCAVTCVCCRLAIKLCFISRRTFDIIQYSLMTEQNWTGVNVFKHSNDICVNGSLWQNLQSYSYWKYSHLIYVGST